MDNEPVGGAEDEVGRGDTGGHGLVCQRCGWHPTRPIESAWQLLCSHLWVSRSQS